MAVTKSGASDDVADADARSDEDSGEDKRVHTEEEEEGEEEEVDMTLCLDDLREIFSGILGVNIPSPPLPLD